MTGSTQTPGNVMVSGPNMPTQQVTSLHRMVTFIIYCAPRDDKNLNPMYTAVYGHDEAHRAVTDSASYLTGLPYVAVDAKTKKVIYPIDSSHGKTAVFGQKTSLTGLNDGTRNVHTLPPIPIPDHVTRIALHIANDAYQENRNFQLFAWDVPDFSHSKVHIYELRSDLQEKFSELNHLGNTPPENSVAAKPGTVDEYFAYLNGDLWLSLSHEFTDADITRLCPPETISRNLAGGNNLQHALPNSPASLGPTQATAGNTPPRADGPHVFSGPVTGGQINSAAIASVSQPHIAGNIEQLEVDWLVTLTPIYAAGAGSRSLEKFNVEIPTLGIMLVFGYGAVANAINASNSTTVQQALRRTSPRAFAAILKAAWRLGINTVDFSSSWRPMLGSRLHKMGVALDVTEFVDSADHIDFRIHNHSAVDRNHPFPSSAGGQKLSQLYQELNGDGEVMHGAVYTPWVNWVQPHDTHMHITVKF